VAVADKWSLFRGRVLLQRPKLGLKNCGRYSKAGSLAQVWPDFLNLWKKMGLLHLSFLDLYYRVLTILTLSIVLKFIAPF
jgi:hypothetical protein